MTEEIKGFAGIEKINKKMLDSMVVNSTDSAEIKENTVNYKNNKEANTEAEQKLIISLISNINTITDISEELIGDLKKTLDLGKFKNGSDDSNINTITDVTKELSNSLKSNINLDKFKN